MKYSDAELEKRCKEVKIDLNEIASDVIYCFNIYGYDFHCNGRRSNDIQDLIPNDRNFIVCMHDTKIAGIYVHYDEEYEMLIIIVAKHTLDGEWVETGQRMYITRYSANTDIYSDDDMSKHAFISVFNACDICGQAVYSEEGFVNKYARSTENARKLFGRVVLQTDSKLKTLSGEEKFHVFDMYAPIIFEEYDDFLSLASKIGHFVEDFQNYTMRYETGYTKLFGYDNSPTEAVKDNGEMLLYSGIKEADILKGCEKLPKVVEEKIKLLKTAYTDERPRRMENDWFAFCILQRFGGDIIQRSFIMIPQYRYPLSETTVEVVEYSRNQVSLNRLQYIDNALVWRDDFKGTDFAYVTEVIDSYISSFWESFKESRCIEDSENDADDSFFMTYGISGVYCVKIMVLMAMPVFEKVYKVFGENIQKYILKNAFYEFKLCLQKNRDEVGKNILEAVFSYADMSKKTVYDIIGISPCFVSLLKEVEMTKPKWERFSLMFYRIFGTEESRKYLRKLNAEKAKELFLAMYEMASDENNCRVETIGYIAEMYGVKDVIKYFKKINMFNATLDNTELMNYRVYIHSLHEIYKNEKLRYLIKELSWNIKANELDYAVSLTWILNQDYPYLKKQYELKADEWMKYCGENKDFILTYPVKPEDIVFEGICLRHCVKSFAAPVAEGKTVILFLRRKSAVNKPYYTVEVRDGIVRQVHGFSNCCLEKGSDEIAFLNSVFDGKGVLFDPDNINELLEV